MAKKKTAEKHEEKLANLFDGMQPVFIVGGGASLKGFDWGLLDGKQVLALNTAYRKLRGATAMFFGCRNFYDQWKDLHPRHDFWRFTGRVFTSLPEFRDHPRIEVVDPGVGGNTGVQAIAVAQKLGAERIVLLGFDGRPGHWHEGTAEAHRFAEPVAATYERYNADYSKVSGEIVNCSPESLISFFPIEPLSTYLKGA